MLGASAATGVTGRALGFWGQGGIGKTDHAISIAQDEQVRRAFPDGVYWVAVGQRPDILGLQRDLLDRLGLAAAPTSAIEARAALAGAVRDRHVLFVVDDVWSTAAADAFRVTADSARVLYTTRSEQVLGDVGAEVHRIDVLSEAVARRLLAETANILVDDLPDDAVTQILASTGRVALAVALAGATIRRSGLAFHEVVGRLAAAHATFLDHPYADTFRAMRLTVDALDEQMRAAYLELAAFPQDTPIPIETVARLWAHTRQWDATRARSMIDQLYDSKLLRVEGEAVAFHDLQHKYLTLAASSVPIAHDTLLDSYGDLVDPDSWGSLPLDESYLWGQLAGHLRAAGRYDELAATVTDVRHMFSRVQHGGAHGVERDLAMAAEVASAGSGIPTVARRVGQVAHLLDQARSIDAVEATLAMQLRPVAGHIANLANISGHLAARWAPDRLTTSGQQRVLDGHTGGVNAVAWAPDGTRLATASMNETVRIWDTTSGTQIYTLIDHTGGVYAVAWAPDGTRLASASGDQTVRIWDTTSGTQTGELTGHTGGTTSVAWARDGSLLASGDASGVVRVFASDDAKLRASAVVSESCQAVTFDLAGSAAAVGTDRGVSVIDVELASHHCRPRAARRSPWRDRCRQPPRRRRAWR